MDDTSNVHKLSALSGLGLVFLLQFKGEEMVKTFMLAGIGSVSSFIFTIGLNYLRDYFKKR